MTPEHHDYITDVWQVMDAELAQHDGRPSPTPARALAERVNAIAVGDAWTADPPQCADSDDGSPCVMRATMVALPPVWDAPVPCCEVHAREYAREYEAQTRPIEPADVPLARRWWEAPLPAAE